MSATITGKVFWTKFVDLSYFGKNKKRYQIKETTAKIVMLAIADSSDDFGENSYQSFETIAEKASIQRRSAIRVVRALISNGYLKIAGLSRYGTNNFSIAVEKLGEPPKRRARIGRPKTSDSEAKTSDSEAKTSDGESPYPSFNHPLEEGFGAAFAFYMNNFNGSAGSYDSQYIGDLVDEHTSHWVIEAMKIAVQRGKRSLSYVNGILERWKSQGYGSEFPSKNGNSENTPPRIPIVKAPQTERPVVSVEKLRAARRKMETHAD